MGTDFSRFVVRRDGLDRRVLDSLNAGTPGEAVGKIEKGCELFGIYKGQYTLFKLAEHILEQIGPSDLLVATWAATTSEMEHTWELLDSDHIRSARWIVDKSFPNRQPAYYERLLETFGPGAVVMGKCHLKVLALKNERWNIVIRPSMNMSPRIQFEQWDVSDDPRLMAVVENLIAHLAEDSAADCQRKTRKRVAPRLSYGDAENNGQLEFVEFSK